MIKESSKDRVLDKILQNYILQEDMSKPVDSDNFVTSFQIRKNFAYQHIKMESLIDLFKII